MKKPVTVSPLLVLLLVAVLSGCTPFIGKAPGRTYFVLTDPAEAAYDHRGLPRTDLRLLVRESDGGGFINSHKIVYTNDPQRYHYYQLSSWVEPPTDRFTSLLHSRLERSGSFRSVSRLGGSTIGDLQLNTELLQFFHDTSDSPGKGEVKVRAELIDLRSREVLAQTEFHGSASAKEYNARGAVEALSTAASLVLDQLVPWAAAAARQVPVNARPNSRGRDSSSQDVAIGQEGASAESPPLQ